MNTKGLRLFLYFYKLSYKADFGKMKAFVSLMLFALFALSVNGDEKYENLRGKFIQYFEQLISKEYCT